MNTPQKNVWGMVQAILQTQIDQFTFSAWLARTEQISFDHHELVIGTPSEYISGEIERRFKEKVEEATRQVGDQNGMQIEVILFKVSQRLAEEALLEYKEISPPSPPIQTKLNLDPTIPRIPDTTYDKYVVHAGNEEAFWFVKSVTAAPPCMLAPVIYIYGDPGTGKTALAQCALHDFKERHNGRRFVTHHIRVGDWYDRYQSKFDGMKDPKTKPKPRKDAKTDKPIPPYDRNEYFGHAVLWDDINAISGGKTSSQDALFWILKAMTEKGKKRGQVIVTASCLPEQLKGFPLPFISLLSSGLVLRIDRPDPASSLKILRSKTAEFTNLRVEPGALDLVAKSMSGDIRAMIGILSQASLLCQRDPKESAQMDMFLQRPHEPGKTLTIKAVRGVLERRGITPYSETTVGYVAPVKAKTGPTSIGDILEGKRSPNGKIDAQKVKWAVERHLNLPDVFNGNKATPTMIYAREVIIFLCRSLLNMEELETATALKTNRLAVFIAGLSFRKKLEEQNEKAIKDLMALKNILGLTD